MHSIPKDIFDIKCRQCARLASFLDQVSQEYPDYYCRPVPPFGDGQAHLLIVGLAPGKHGANASGRPFTGDHAGIMLYQTLFRYGFASKPQSRSANDGLCLVNCRISNAVKCLPPENKPTGAEIRRCNPYIASEIRSLPSGSVILALGTIAHNAVLQALAIKQSSMRFGHNITHKLPDGQVLVDSYHCSRYNTQTRRLTEAMFHDVFENIRTLIAD